MSQSPHPPAPVRLLINGARGRMGALLVHLAGADARCMLAAQRDVDQPGQDGDFADARVDVVIDFSSDAGAREACRIARRHHAALLVGSTGLSSGTQALLDEATESIAVLVASNTSLGVAVLTHLAGEAARLLGPAFDVDIIETHHTMKKDAPSGTALRVARAIEQHTASDAGATTPFPPQRIHAIRAGDVVGEHVVHFTGCGERLTLAHVATSRELFARGALRASVFLAGKPPGRYTIEQALGIA